MDETSLMKRTLALARRAEGMTSPNPMVGAILVKRGKIIAEGYHKKAGTPHAEAIVIDAAGDMSSGATLYVSLEPCCHREKRTPPCTQKIISSGIAKVVVAMEDPNPKVSGKGIEELRKAGIIVVSGVMEERARLLNEHYIKHITTGMPFVIMKVAMTLDGKIATPEGESKWITGEKARLMVHRVRGSVDALLSAIGTVKADDPRLTCRLGRKRSPARVIIDPELEIRPNACVLSTPPDTILVTRKGDHEGQGLGRIDPRHEKEKKKDSLLKRGIQFLEFAGEKVDLKWLMGELGAMGITSVLVEGGSSLNSYCIQSGIVDKVMFFIAPKIMGGKESFPAVGGMSFRRLQDAYPINDIKVRRIGNDILVEGYMRRRGLPT